jgi:bifunctional non-homologous end joining protein LigD
LTIIGHVLGKIIVPAQTRTLRKREETFSAGLMICSNWSRRCKTLLPVISRPSLQSKGLEGVVAKRKTSTYRPGKRSPDWLKIKARPQQEFVVCGFTEGKGSRKHFGALLLGGYRNGRLRYFGHSGTGFSEKGLKEAIDRLKPLFMDKSPVENPPKIPEKIQWVQPRLVCEVAYAEWTQDEQLRQTTFLGWRDDKSPKDVVL